MPIFGLSTSLQNNANAILASSFMTRYNELTWPKIGQAAPAVHRFVEPFALLGAAPLMSAFFGNMNDDFFNSFKLQVPMTLFKNKVNVSRPDLEFDQTGKSVLGAISRVGANMPLGQDFSLASKLMRSHLETTMTSFFDGKSYAITFDGYPTYSGNHTFDGGATTQTNIFTSNLSYTT